MKFDPKEDPKKFFRQFALDLLANAHGDGLGPERVIDPDDISTLRGICQVDLDAWPNPVLIAFSVADIVWCDDPSIDAQEAAEERELEVLAGLRKDLETIGLEELACCDLTPTGFALVAQLANPKHDLKKAARELTKLLWDLPE
jgi:hypothetical protein